MNYGKESSKEEPTLLFCPFPEQSLQPLRADYHTCHERAHDSGVRYQVFRCSRFLKMEPSPVYRHVSHQAHVVPRETHLEVPSRLRLLDRAHGHHNSVDSASLRLGDYQALHPDGLQEFPEQLLQLGL